MPNKLTITEVRYVRIAPRQSLIGFISIVVNEIFIGSIAVHTTLNRKYRLVYPSIKGFNVVRPLKKLVGEEIERIAFPVIEAGEANRRRDEYEKKRS